MGQADEAPPCRQVLEACRSPAGLHLCQTRNWQPTSPWYCAQVPISRLQVIAALAAGRYRSLRITMIEKTTMGPPR